MELEPITMDALNYLCVLVYRELQTLLLWFRLSRVLFLRDLGQIVFPLVVSRFNLFPLEVTC